ncbi:uncharacterized protein LOC111054655 isoform X2 [Nilaparvata lugens]|uniref:uncharacterized protein LOC111054655 isoform X2 n=1 Tax=Nilaparvata lugens TaxID=108931 RepID=UPI00193D7BA8|nr:uncharacterized protein LOC111054655 isoform X2 [Nilaparvata lugens]
MDFGEFMASWEPIPRAEEDNQPAQISQPITNVPLSRSGHHDNWVDPQRFSGNSKVLGDDFGKPVVDSRDVSNSRGIDPEGDVPGIPEDIPKENTNPEECSRKLKRKVMVLPPSESYRGFCNIDQVTTGARKQRQTVSPQRVTGDLVTSSQPRSSKQVKVMRLVSPERTAQQVGVKSRKICTLQTSPAKEFNVKMIKPSPTKTTETVENKHRRDENSTKPYKRDDNSTKPYKRDDSSAKSTFSSGVTQRKPVATMKKVMKISSSQEKHEDLDDHFNKLMKEAKAINSQVEMIRGSVDACEDGGEEVKKSQPRAVKKLATASPQKALRRKSTDRDKDSAKDDQKSEKDKKYDRDAALSYMKQKKLQMKEKQAREMDRKRSEEESRQHKLQALQATQLKLLQNALKRKDATQQVRRNWEGPVNGESSPPPPLPVHRTNSDARIKHRKSNSDDLNPPKTSNDIKNHPENIEAGPSFMSANEDNRVIQARKSKSIRKNRENNEIGPSFVGINEGNVIDLPQESSDSRNLHVDHPQESRDLRSLHVDHPQELNDLRNPPVESNIGQQIAGNLEAGPSFMGAIDENLDIPSRKLSTGGKSSENCSSFVAVGSESCLSPSRKSGRRTFEITEGGPSFMGINGSETCIIPSSKVGRRNFENSEAGPSFVGINQGAHVNLSRGTGNGWGGSENVEIYPGLVNGETCRLDLKELGDPDGVMNFEDEVSRGPSVSRVPSASNSVSQFNQVSRRPKSKESMFDHRGISGNGASRRSNSKEFIFDHQGDNVPVRSNERGSIGGALNETGPQKRNENDDKTEINSNSSASFIPVYEDEMRVITEEINHIEAVLKGIVGRNDTAGSGGDKNRGRRRMEEEEGRKREEKTGGNASKVAKSGSWCELLRSKNHSRKERKNQYDEENDSSDLPHTTTQDDSISGGPINELTDEENLYQLSSQQPSTRPHHQLNISTKLEEKIVPEYIKALDREPNPLNFITAYKSKLDMLKQQRDRVGAEEMSRNKSADRGKETADRGKASRNKTADRKQYGNESADRGKTSSNRTADCGRISWNKSGDRKDRIGGGFQGSDFKENLTLQDLETGSRSGDFSRRNQGRMFQGVEEGVYPLTSESPELVSRQDGYYQPLSMNDLKLNFPPSLKSDDTTTSGRNSECCESEDILVVNENNRGGFLINSEKLFKAKSDSQLEKKLQPSITTDLVRSLTLGHSLATLEVVKSANSGSGSSLSLTAPNDCVRMGGTTGWDGGKVGKVGNTGRQERGYTGRRENEAGNTVGRDNEGLRQSGGAWSEIFGRNEVGNTVGQEKDGSRGTWREIVGRNEVGNSGLRENSGATVGSNDLAGFVEPKRVCRERSRPAKATLPSGAGREAAGGMMEIGNVFSPAAIHLQFQAELSKLDAYEVGLQQLTDSERLHNMALKSLHNQAKYEQQHKSTSIDNLNKWKTTTVENKQSDVDDPMVMTSSHHSPSSSSLSSSSNPTTNHRGSRQKESVTSSPDQRGSRRKGSVTSSPNRQVYRQKESVTSSPDHRGSRQKESVTSSPDHRGSHQKESVASSPDHRGFRHRESVTSSPNYSNSRQKGSVTSSLKSIAESLISSGENFENLVKPSDRLVDDGSNLGRVGSDQNFGKNGSDGNLGLTLNPEAQLHASVLEQTIATLISNPGAQVLDNLLNDSNGFEHLMSSTHALTPLLDDQSSCASPFPSSCSNSIFDKCISYEEARSEHQLNVYKSKEKELINRVKVQVSWLEFQKKRMKQKGLEEEAKNIKKKQRGLILKSQQIREEIQRLMKAEKMASEERRKLLHQQKLRAIHQLSVKDSTKKRRTNEVNLKKSLQSTSSSTTSVVESLLSTEEGSVYSEPRSLQNVDEPKRHLLERKKTAIARNRPVDVLSPSKKRFEEKDLNVEGVELRNVNSPKQTTARSVLDRSTSPFQMSVVSENVETAVGSDTAKSHSDVIEEDIQEETDNANSVPEELVKSNQSDSVESHVTEELPQYSESTFEQPSFTIHSRQPTPLRTRTDQTDSRSSQTRTASDRRTALSSMMIPIKVPLSPRLQGCTRKRYSSGSEDSITFSQNETFSEQSDIEIRLSALHEQLRQRKMEADRLRREQKRAQRERLKCKEQALLKQIQAYDAYIEQVKKELEQELESPSTVPIMRPQIKQPKFVDKISLRKPEAAVKPEPEVAAKPEVTSKPPTSDEDLSSLKSVSEASSLETTIESPGKRGDGSLDDHQSSLKVVTSSTSPESEGSLKNLAPNIGETGSGGVSSATSPGSVSEVLGLKNGGSVAEEQNFEDFSANSGSKVENIITSVTSPPKSVEISKNLRSENGYSESGDVLVKLGPGNVLEKSVGEVEILNENWVGAAEFFKNKTFDSPMTERVRKTQHYTLEENLGKTVDDVEKSSVKTVDDVEKSSVKTDVEILSSVASNHSGKSNGEETLSEVEEILKESRENSESVESIVEQIEAKSEEGEVVEEIEEKEEEEEEEEEEEGSNDTVDTERVEDILSEKSSSESLENNFDKQDNIDTILNKYVDDNNRSNKVNDNFLKESSVDDILTSANSARSPELKENSVVSELEVIPDESSDKDSIKTGQSALETEEIAGSALNKSSFSVKSGALEVNPYDSAEDTFESDIDASENESSIPESKHSSNLSIPDMFPLPVEVSEGRRSVEKSLKSVEDGLRRVERGFESVKDGQKGVEDDRKLVDEDSEGVEGSKIPVEDLKMSLEHHRMSPKSSKISPDGFESLDGHKTHLDDLEISPKSSKMSPDCLESREGHKTPLETLKMPLESHKISPKGHKNEELLSEDIGKYSQLQLPDSTNLSLDLSALGGSNSFVHDETSVSSLKDDLIRVANSVIRDETSVADLDENLIRNETSVVANLNENLIRVETSVANLEDNLIRDETSVANLEDNLIRDETSVANLGDDLIHNEKSLGNLVKTADDEFPTGEVREEDDLSEVSEALSYNKEENLSKTSSSTESSSEFTVQKKAKLVSLNSSDSDDKSNQDYETSFKEDEVIKVILVEKEKIVGRGDDNQGFKRVREEEEVEEEYGEEEEGEDEGKLGEEGEEEEEGEVVEELEGDDEEKEDDILVENVGKKEEIGNKDEKIDKITDNILLNLLNESLTFSPKVSSTTQEFTHRENCVTNEKTLNGAVENLRFDENKENGEEEGEEDIKDATDSVLKIYGKKMGGKGLELKDMETSGEKAGDETSKNIPEFNSPSKDSSFDSNDGSWLKDEAENELEVSGGDSEAFWLAEGVGGDLDMGLEHSCKEARQLQLQRLQIEQEIKQLQQVQDQIPSYYFLREIPNKPPPPYTPPGQARAKLAADQIPTERHEILEIVNNLTEYIYTQHSQGKDIHTLTPPKNLIAGEDSSQGVYKRFLFDLTKQIVFENKYKFEEEDSRSLLPWEKIDYKQRCVVARSLDELKAVTSRRVKVLYGFEPQVNRENLIVQWSKKHNKIDKFLVNELQEEECEWTDFSKQELLLKNKVTADLLDQLIGETADVVGRAWAKKVERGSGGNKT